MLKDIHEYHIYRYHHIDNGMFLDVNEVIEAINEESMGNQTIDMDKRLNKRIIFIFLKRWMGRRWRY